MSTTLPAAPMSSPTSWAGTDRTDRLVRAPLEPTATGPNVRWRLRVVGASRLVSGTPTRTDFVGTGPRHRHGGAADQPLRPARHRHPTPVRAQPVRASAWGHTSAHRLRVG